MSEPPHLEQREATRRARNEAEDAKAKELEVDVLWLREAIAHFEKVCRSAKRFEGMVMR